MELEVHELGAAIAQIEQGDRGVSTVEPVTGLGCRDP